MVNHPTQTSVSSLSFYSRYNLEKIHPFKDVSAIQGLSNKFKKLWDVFNEAEYNSKFSIVKIMEFIECLVKKKGEWTQSREGAKVLHDIFVSLSKTSPRVFLDD